MPPGFDLETKAGRQLTPDELLKRLRLERHAARELRRILEKQLRQVMVAVQAGKSLDEILRIFDDTPELRTAIERVLLDGGAEGIMAGETQLGGMGISIDWEMVNIAARDWARAYSYELVKGINSTTRKLLQTEVPRWIESGEPLSVLKRDLEPYFGQKRAGLIATTETTRTFQQGAVQTYRDSGVVGGMQVVTANDEKVCPICAPLGGLIFGEDGAVPGSRAQQKVEGIRGGLDGNFVHPGGGGAASKYEGQTLNGPPFHGGCRCGTIPVIIEAMA